MRPGRIVASGTIDELRGMSAGIGRRFIATLAQPLVISADIERLLREPRSSTPSTATASATAWAWKHLTAILGA